MKNTLLKINKPLPDLHRRIFQEVFGAAAKLDLEPIIVGAAARDLVFDFVYEAAIERKTEDLDFAIAFGSWNEYDQLRNSLIESGSFRTDRKAVHRLWLKNSEPEMRIDLVPFGGLEDPDGSISFPPDDDFVMNTVGFPEAARNSMLIDVGRGLVVRVVSPAGLAMLKFVSYSDRPHVRQRDVQDISFVATHYLHAGNEDRLYESERDLLEHEDFDLRVCGARLLGRDIGRMITGEIHLLIRQWIGDGPNTDTFEQFSAVLTNVQLDRREAREAAERLMGELWKGVEEGRAKQGE